jgi:hypothetical protein
VSLRTNRSCGQPGAKEYGLASQVMSRVTSAKWIGDSANHGYRVKINEADLEHSVTDLRLFLWQRLPSRLVASVGLRADRAWTLVAPALRSLVAAVSSLNPRPRLSRLDRSGRNRLASP